LLAVSLKFYCYFAIPCSHIVIIISLAPQLTIYSNTKDEVYDSLKHQSSTFKAEADCIEFSSLNLSVKGDVKFVMFEAKKKEKMFHFWFNTNMIDDNKFVLAKVELDGKAAKDKKHEKYPETLMIEVTFVGDPSSPPLSLDKSGIPPAVAQNNSSGSLTAPPSSHPAITPAPAPPAPPPQQQQQQHAQVQQQITQLQQQFQSYQAQQAEYYKQYYQYFQQNPAAYQQYQVQQQQQQDQYNQQLSQLQQQLHQ